MSAAGGTMHCDCCGEFVAYNPAGVCLSCQRLLSDGGVQ